MSTDHPPSDHNTTRGVALRLLPLALFILLLLLLPLLRPSCWLPAIARVLIVDQAPTPADAILVLGGGDGSRQDRAIALYAQGYAPVVISSGERPMLPGVWQSYARLAADYMVERGVPREAIALFEDTTSTREEALAARTWAQEQGYTSLLVVTDAYHTRRSALTMRRAFRETSVRITVVAAQAPWFDAGSWWAAERPLLAVFEEYVKFGYYTLKGYIP
ncbi:MAG: YdcF family protein [Anaerolineae bacterium]